MSYQKIKIDTLDRFSWSKQIIDYTDAGVIKNLSMTQDNGTMFERSYVNGKIDHMVMTDGAGADSTSKWDTIDISYDLETGKMSSRTTDYDNGTSRVETFDGGQRVSTMTYDAPEGNGVMGWSSLETYFDSNGKVSQYVTNYDDGTVKSTAFENGARTEIHVTDESDVKSWTTIDKTYDANGAMASSDIQYDNGVSMVYLYQNGIRSSVVKTDGSGDQSTARWDKVETYFDEEGQRASINTTYDNGTVKQDNYSFGKLTSTTMSDIGNTESWDEIYTSYDELGNIARRETYNDNGIIKQEQFVEGTRVATVQLDNPEGLGESVKNWTENNTYYNADGTIDINHVVNDNFDEFVFQYAEGSKVSKIDMDGDESQDWLFQVTDYDANGDVANVQTYDFVEDVPEQYLVSLGYLIGREAPGEGEGEIEFFPIDVY